MEALVILENDEVVTSSLQIADSFEKRHTHVLEAIENKIHSAENSAQYKKMFKEDTYEDASGKKNKMYYMNRDGFVFIAMGFTGKRADEFKLAYIDQFNKMEKAIQEVYHVSETALTNNVMKEIESKLINKIDDRLEMYEENFRPTHANKIKINNYIKDSLGVDIQPEEANLVKRRVLLMLDAESWQDVPYKKLTGNMRLIDESIQAVKGFRERRQLDLFENYL